MLHRVEIAPAAERDLRKLPQRARERLEPVILALGAEPRPRGVRKVQATERAYRIRMGEYRVVYEIYDDVALVVVLKVVRRSEASYRGI